MQMRYLSPSECLIDRISWLQKAKAEHESFRELSQLVMVVALHEGSQIQRVDIIFDVYSSPSIKDAERHRRGPDQGIKFKSITGQTIHQ